MSTDLNQMSLKELRELQTQVAKAISGFEERRKKDALAKLEENAKAMGFTLAELTGAQTGRKRAAVVPKYANPADKAQTWTGRGRKPRWFADAMKSGKNPSDLMI